MSLLPATLEVSYDELAFNLSELIQPAPVGVPRRFQIILVIRNDALAEYRIDLGPARASFRMTSIIWKRLGAPTGAGWINSERLNASSS